VLLLSISGHSHLVYKICPDNFWGYGHLKSGILEFDVFALLHVTPFLVQKFVVKHFMSKKKYFEQFNDKELQSS